MISATQIRAALAMLNWPVEELAASAGVTSRTISSIRNGHHTGSKQLLEKIQTIFENAGVRFVDHDGVVLNPERIKIIESNDTFLLLMDDIEQHLLTHDNKEILYLFADNRKCSEALRAAERRVRDLGMTMRFVIENGNPYRDYPDHEYRTVPSDQFYGFPQVVYGDKVATTLAAQKEVMILWNADVAELQRKIFEVVWQTGLPVDA